MFPMGGMTMLRPGLERDLPEMLEIYRPYVEGSCVSFEEVLPDLAAFRRRFRGITARFPWLVWEEGGRVLGYAYASAPFERAAYRWCAEISVYVAADAHRRGIGGALCAALEERLVREGYFVVYALITSENKASLAFHAARGYRLLAEFPDSGYKDGRWLSVTWMEKRLRPLRDPPGPPELWDGK